MYDIYYNDETYVSLDQLKKIILTAESIGADLIFIDVEEVDYPIGFKVHFKIQEKAVE